jgi:hypothetical protein
MSKNSKISEFELGYTIKKKDIMAEAIQRFFRNKIQLFIGPILIITGLFLLKKYAQLEVGITVIVLGVLYMALPYIIVFVNMRKIEDAVVKFNIYDDKLVMNDGKYKMKIKYTHIECISENEYFIEISPKKGCKEFSQVLRIPKRCIDIGDYKEFIKVLNFKINNKNMNNVNMGCKEKETIKTKFARKTILKYEVNKKDIFNFVKKEYYSIKRYIFYGGVFAIIGVFLIWVNKIAGIIVILIGASYLFYPYMFSLFKIRKIEDAQIQFDLCSKDTIRIIGNDIDTEIPIKSIKVLGENELNAKIMISIGRGLIFYIPKNRILQGSIKEFYNLLPKSNFMEIGNNA